MLLKAILPDSLNPASYSLITYAIYGLFFIIILYYIFKERRSVAHKTLNKYVIDTTEIIPTVSYFSYPAETIQHIFWSGGPHSTALLCYCLIVLGQPVQPIFFTESVCSGNLKHIKHVRKTLIAKYPHLQSRLLPTWYVASVNKYRDITGLFAQLKKASPGIPPTFNFKPTPGGSENDVEAVALHLANDSMPVQTVPDTNLAKWDVCTRFAYSDDGGILTFMMANTVESLLFANTNIKGGNQVFVKVFGDKLKNKVSFPHAHMTHDGIKQLALDSKNYYWDLVSG